MCVCVSVRVCVGWETGVRRSWKVREIVCVMKSEITYLSNDVVP